MNLNSLKSAQTVIDELCPLTRTFERENCQTALLGLIRQGQELSLYALADSREEGEKYVIEC